MEKVKKFDHKAGNAKFKEFMGKTGTFMKNST